MSDIPGISDATLASETQGLSRGKNAKLTHYPDVDRAAKCMASLAHYGMYLEERKGEG